MAGATNAKEFLSGENITNALINPFAGAKLLFDAAN